MQKDEAKKRGAQFDWKVKKWYTTKEKLYIFADLCEPLVESKRIYLEIPFEIKDEAKARGAKFDFKKKKWYTSAANKNKFSDISFNLNVGEEQKEEEEDLAISDFEQVVCMYVMHVCMHVCIYLCMYLCIYLCVHASLYKYMSQKVIHNAMYICIHMYVPNLNGY